jgi:periplasmic protein CpxP/Spy
MRTKVFISIMSLIAMLGFGVQPSLADPERGYSHASSDEHGCCAEMMGHMGSMGNMGHMGHMGHDVHSADHLRHLLKHQKEIGLTEEQVKKLKAIELDFDRGWIKSDAEIHVAERELLALVEDEKTDLSAIEAKVKQSGMLEVGLRMLAFKARHDALGVLTPEQREKGKAAHENRMRGMSGMSGMHEMMSGQYGGSPGRGH